MVWTCALDGAVFVAAARGGRLRARGAHGAKTDFDCHNFDFAGFRSGFRSGRRATEILDLRRGRKVLRRAVFQFLRLDNIGLHRRVDFSPNNRKWGAPANPVAPNFKRHADSGVLDKRLPFRFAVDSSFCWSGDFSLDLARNSSY